jgi:hypothetical protein
MRKHKYVAVYRTYIGANWQEYTIEMEGRNPFDAFTDYRAAHPSPVIWASQIVSIVRQKSE